MDTMDNNLPVRPSPGVTLRDFLVFQSKLVLDGVKDLILLNLSVIAIFIDAVSGRAKHPRLFYGVVRFSRRFEGWLKLHRLRGARIDDEEGTILEDLIDGAPDADRLADELERLVRREVAGIRGRA